MSRQIGEISGPIKTEITVTKFYGGASNGTLYQLTQVTPGGNANWITVSREQLLQLVQIVESGL